MFINTMRNGPNWGANCVCVYVHVCVSDSGGGCDSLESYQNRAHYSETALFSFSVPRWTWWVKDVSVDIGCLGGTLEYVCYSLSVGGEYSVCYTRGSVRHSVM